MAENRSIVADSGPLIGLARIGSLDLIQSIFNTVLIPTAVAAECCRDSEFPGARLIHAAIEEQQLQVAEPPGPADIVFPPSLGAGERAVIELSLVRRTGALMDDRLGRQVAKRIRIRVLGTGGLLLLAKQRGAVATIEPLLSDLLNQGYRISRAVVEELLRRAGETDNG